MRNWYRGKRIRAGDRHLVFSFACFFFGVIFLVPLLWYMAELIFQHGWTFAPYITQKQIGIRLLLSAMASILGVMLYVRFGKEHLLELLQRQEIARMVLENGWYEKEKKEASFWGNWNTEKVSITWFPKMYYKKSGRMIFLVVKLTMGKYQEQYKTLEKKLESGLDCELLLKEIKHGEVTYELIQDLEKDRMEISEVSVEDGKLRLMKNLSWEFDRQPHLLICGGTGSGKSYFILALVEALIKSGASLSICDPKNADLADLGEVMRDVFYTKEEIVSCVQSFYEGMLRRMGEMKRRKDYCTGKNYAYYGLRPHFLIFDEYVAFSDMIAREKKIKESLDGQLKQILMLGRQMGYFVILACQRPDAKYLGDGMRDQFNFRVALGRVSELGYSMMFGDTVKDFCLKDIQGRGYVDYGESVITEFYTPFVPQGHEFQKEIGIAYRKSVSYNVKME